MTGSIFRSSCAGRRMRFVQAVGMQRLSLSARAIGDVISTGPTWLKTTSFGSAQRTHLLERSPLDALMIRFAI